MWKVVSNWQVHRVGFCLKILSPWYATIIPTNCHNYLLNLRLRLVLNSAEMWSNPRREIPVHMCSNFVPQVERSRRINVRTNIFCGRGRGSTETCSVPSCGGRRGAFPWPTPEKKTICTRAGSLVSGHLRYCHPLTFYVGASGPNSKNMN